MLSDTLSDLDKLNHGKYSKYGACLYTIYVQMDMKSSQGGDQDTLGHLERPWQAQPWGVQQVPGMFIDMMHINIPI